jgi:hypothetical protein
MVYELYPGISFLLEPLIILFFSSSFLFYLFLPMVWAQ